MNWKTRRENILNINGHPLIGYALICLVGLMVIGTFASLWGAYRARGQKMKIDQPPSSPANQPWHTDEDEQWHQLSEQVKSLKHDKDK